VPIPAGAIPESHQWKTKKKPPQNQHEREKTFHMDRQPLGFESSLFASSGLNQIPTPGLQNRTFFEQLGTIWSKIGGW
jgi:hypothetical protein